MTTRPRRRYRKGRTMSQAQGMRGGVPRAAARPGSLARLQHDAGCAVHLSGDVHRVPHEAGQHDGNQSQAGPGHVGRHGAPGAALARLLGAAGAAWATSHARGGRPGSAQQAQRAGAAPRPPGVGGEGDGRGQRRRAEQACTLALAFFPGSGAEGFLPSWTASATALSCASSRSVARQVVRKEISSDRARPPRQHAAGASTSISRT